MVRQQEVTSFGVPDDGLGHQPVDHVTNRHGTDPQFGLRNGVSLLAHSIACTGDVTATVNTWQYVVYVVNLLVDQIRGHPGKIVIADDAQAIDDALPVELESSHIAGTHYYIQDGWSERFSCHSVSFGHVYLIHPVC